MSSSRASGVFAPVMTPFREDLNPDAGRFVAHCQWLLEQGARLAVFGTNGEANSLAADEKLDLLDRLLEAGVNPAHLMPGTGNCALSSAARLTAEAVSRGCHDVLMLPPFYYKDVSDDGLFAFYAQVIERVASEHLNIYLYHFPAMSRVPLSLALIERLARAFPTAIAGIKDSSGDSNHTRALNELGIPDFRVFCGSERFLLENLRAGGAGCISATINVNPRAIRGLYDHWREPDAERRQLELQTIRTLFERYPLIAGMKAATAHYTNDPTWLRVRPPLTPLTTPEANALQHSLSQAGFRMPDLDEGTTSA